MADFTRLGNDLYSGARTVDFVGHRRRWYLISAILVLVSLTVPFLRGGYHLGVEFTGGAQYTVNDPSSLNQDLGKNAVTATIGEPPESVAQVGQDALRIQTKSLNSTDADRVQAALQRAYGSGSQITVQFIGPSWGQSISSTAIRGLVVFLVLVALFMAVYFRTWKMSVAALVALFHDLIITAGVYGIVGFEVTPAAVIGFLTILGYSLYDTVVVFDKIRENTNGWRPGGTKTFAETVNAAVNQTLVRSINTSIVALLPIGAILFIGALLLGAGTLRDISLALFIGIIVGTYSTIFLAAPLYTDLRSTEPRIRIERRRVLAQRGEADAAKKAEKDRV